MRDIIFLQDLSGSFSDDLVELQLLIDPLLDTLIEQEPDTRFGITSFVDKPVGGFGSIGDYVYQVNVPLTTERNNISATVDSFSVLSGGDGDEAQLEGLLQASIDRDLGYRADSERFVILATDAGFHVDPDGVEGSTEITRPNNGDDVVDPDEDYPSIAGVRSTLENSDIIPIFLVTSDVRTEYEALVGDLGRGQVVTLTSNSSNVVDAVRLALAEESGDITEGGTEAPDNITGTDGDDGLFGAIGDDTISGGIGNDLIDGGSDNDLLDGGVGADSLEGGTGSDTLDGGADADLIEGGLDADVLSGSSGGDIFAGSPVGLDEDIILDFTEEDCILLRNVDFTNESLTVTRNESSTILDVDVDLNGVIDTSITLEGNYSNNDFVVQSEFSETTGASNTTIKILDTTVYRFFDTEIGTPFYTISESERDFLIENEPTYTFEGESFESVAQARADSLTGVVPVYRFANNNTGSFIYTISEPERNFLQENFTNNIFEGQYTFEDIAYFGYESQQEGTVPVYRLYNPVTDVHFFTPSLEERDSTLATTPDYQLESEDGIAYYVEPLVEI